MLCEFPKSDVVQEKDVTTFKKFRLQSLFITITEIRIYYLSHLFITLLFILLYIINNNYKMKDISCYYYSSYFIYNLLLISVIRTLIEAIVRKDIHLTRLSISNFCLDYVCYLSMSPKFP